MGGSQDGDAAGGVQTGDVAGGGVQTGDVAGGGGAGASSVGIGVAMTGTYAGTGMYVYRRGSTGGCCNLIYLINISNTRDA